MMQLVQGQEYISRPHPHVVYLCALDEVGSGRMVKAFDS